VKLRLPGLTRTYSLSFLFLLFGVARFSLPEVLIAGCAGALVQSVCNAKQRPTMVQALFNMANLAISVGACFLVENSLVATGLGRFQPAALALVACVYFVVNTVLVSGVLALLEGKPLAAVCQDWYVWSFPYYLIGAVLVGLVSQPGRSVPGEAWFLLLPLLYLIHFFVGLVKSSPETGKVNRGEELPAQARVFAYGVIAAGAALMLAAALGWESSDPVRFAVYLALAVVGSMFKVRLPGMRGTVAPNFVLTLAAIAQFSLPEVAVIAAMGGIVQCVWKAKKRPTLMRTLFNGASVSLSAAAAFGVCRLLLAGWIDQSLVGLLVLATLVLYGVNTFLVATVICLVDGKPLRSVWQTCYFWSCPYYLVGGAVAGLMVATSRVAGWQPSLLVLPVMGLVYLSYQMHVSQKESAVWGS